MTDKPVKLCKQHKWKYFGDNRYCLNCGTLQLYLEVFQPTKMLAIAEVVNIIGDINEADLLTYSGLKERYDKIAKIIEE